MKREDIFNVVTSGDINTVRKYIKDNRDVNIKDRYGRTPLFYAIIDRKDEILDLLVENGARLNISDKEGNTPLHFAAQEYNLHALTSLLEGKVEIDPRNKYGNTPLSNAVYYSQGRGGGIELLLSNGAKPDLKNKHGVSPYNLAKTIANYDVKKFFEKK